MHNCGSIQTTTEGNYERETISGNGQGQSRISAQPTADGEAIGRACRRCSIDHLSRRLVQAGEGGEMICHRPIRRLSAEERDRRDALEHERYHEVKDQVEAEMRAQYEEDFGHISANCILSSRTAAMYTIRYLLACVLIQRYIN